MSADPSFCLFDTAVGGCALVWGAHGISGVLLPEPSDAATRARARRRGPDAGETAPTPDVQRVIGRIQALLEGGRDAPEDIPLYLGAIPEFHRRSHATASRTHPDSS